MNDVSRSMVIYADGQIVRDFDHARLTGRDAIGLLPCSFMLEIWNLSDSSYLKLSRSKKIAVRNKGKVLASGDIADVFRWPVDSGMLTQVCFSIGLSLWETPVSVAVESGKKVSEIVSAILDASATGIQLLSFPADDPVSTRGQAFFGRAAECVSEALLAAGAVGYLVEAGLCVTSDADQDVTLSLGPTDMLSEPYFNGTNLAVLRTSVIGWTVGKRIRVSWVKSRRRVSFVGLIRERTIEADTLSGPWNAQLLVEVIA